MEGFYIKNIIIVSVIADLKRQGSLKMEWSEGITVCFFFWN